MIELTHVYKLFNKGKANEIHALDDVSLTIHKGDFVTMVGSNGSGKTTLLNIISGAIHSTDGKVRINENDVTGMAEYKRSKWIARVFQNPLSGTAPDLSILDNFRLAALRTKKRQLSIGINEAFRQKVKDHVAMLGMGLENKIEQPMGSLSGGQRQALTLLMCIMDDTEILLLDEPTAALDPKSANIVLETANRLIKEYQLTAVFITHNLKDAQQYGNRLIQMSEGKVLRDLDNTAKSQLPLPGLFEWFA